MFFCIFHAQKREIPNVNSWKIVNRNDLNNPHSSFHSNRPFSFCYAGCMVLPLASSGARSVLISLLPHGELLSYYRGYCWKFWDFFESLYTSILVLLLFVNNHWCVTLLFIDSIFQILYKYCLFRSVRYLLCSQFSINDAKHQEYETWAQNTCQ